MFFQVILSDEWEEIECKTPVERTWLLQNPQASSSTKVTAECGPRKTFLGDGWYTLTMYVDTKKVQDTISIQYRDDRTPTITEVKSKRWVRVEDLVEIRGKFYTGEYGFKPDNALDNDNEQLELRGIFIGPNECQMVSLFSLNPDFTVLKMLCRIMRLVTSTDLLWTTKMAPNGVTFNVNSKELTLELMKPATLSPRMVGLEMRVKQSKLTLMKNLLSSIPCLVFHH